MIVSSFPISCRSAETERSVTGMVLSSSRYWVVSIPDNAVCSEIAMSRFVTPARRARAWLIFTNNFLVRCPQSSRIFFVPDMVLSLAFTTSASSNTLFTSIPETRISTAAVGGPYCRKSIWVRRSGNLSRQNSSVFWMRESMISLDVVLTTMMAYSGFDGSGV